MSERERETETERQTDRQSSSSASPRVCVCVFGLSLHVVQCTDSCMHARTHSSAHTHSSEFSGLETYTHGLNRIFWNIFTYLSV